MVIKRIFMVVFAVIIASIPLTSVVGAAGKFDSMSLPDQIKAYILYNSVDECFSGINDFRAADATGTVWSSPMGILA